MQVLIQRRDKHPKLNNNVDSLAEASSPLHGGDLGEGKAEAYIGKSLREHRNREPKRETTTI